MATYRGASMITHVAIRFDGKVYSLPAPNRHHHIIRVIARETGKSLSDNEQGFLDETGNFLNRQQALLVALECKQVKNPDLIRMDMLFSEDLW